VLQGLRAGTVDVIATDHAPHQQDEKAVEFDRAPFGIIGLETAVPLALDRLVHRGVITFRRLVQLMSVNPSRILNLPGGSLRPGRLADVTIIAPSAAIVIDVTRSKSLSRNSPFDGWTLRGAVAATIVGGRTVFVNGEIAGLAALRAAGERG
jgi:dihydroorotase